MKKWLYICLGLMLAISMSILPTAHANEPNGYFDIGSTSFSLFVNGSTIEIMHGEDFTLRYTIINSEESLALYRLDENNQVVILKDVYHSSEDLSHPQDSFRLYATTTVNGTAHPDTDQYVTIQYTDQVDFSYYKLVLSPSSNTLRLGDELTVNVQSYMTDNVAADWQITEYPQDLLQPTDDNTFKVIGQGYGTITVRIMGYHLFGSIEVNENRSWCICFNHDDYLLDGEFHQIPVPALDHPSEADNCFVVGMTHGLTLLVDNGNSLVSYGDEIDDPENVMWSASNDNVTIDNVSKEITFNHVGKTELTAKYRDVTVTTALYIFENDNYAIVGSGLDTTIEPNTRYDSDIQLLCFDEGYPTHYCYGYYILTPDMQEKYGAFLLDDLEGVTVYDDPDDPVHYLYEFDERYLGETITFNFVVSPVNESDIPSDPTLYQDFYVIENGQTRKVSSLSGSITIGEKKPSQEPVDPSRLLQNLVDNNQKEEIIAHQDLLADIYRQTINEGTLDLNAIDLQNLDYCLSVAYQNTIQVKLEGVSEAQGMLTGISQLDLTQPQTITLTARQQTDETKLKQLKQYCNDNGYEVIDAWDISLAKQVNREETVNIDQTIHPVQITLPIPANYQNDCLLIREHNGVYTFLDVSLAKGEMTFSTDCFSTYALVKKKAPVSEYVPNESESSISSSTQTTSPKTSDTVSLTPYLVIGALSLFGSLMIMIRHHKRQKGL